MPEQQAELVVAEELRFFLVPRLRATGEVPVALDGTSTLGHLVEAHGIPLTEVGVLTVDGREVGPARSPRPGDRIDVAPHPRPQPLPYRPPSFLLDVHLGTLARRLRLLGLDTLYSNEADDDELAAVGREEQRVLLTQDRGLLRRRAVWCGAYVRGTRPSEQVADVLGRFRPPIFPWTRCTECNGILVPVAKAEVADRLEPGTRRTQEEFVRCPVCGRVYWPGAHSRGLARLVEEARRLLDQPL